MKSGYVCLLASFIAAESLGQAPPSVPVTVIRAGTLIDGTSASVRRDQAIVVRGNRIESVGPWSAGFGSGRSDGRRTSRVRPFCRG